MKVYEVEFYRNHERLSNQYVTMTIQARDLEQALSRVKKELARLETLPNFYNHSKWLLRSLKEVRK